MHARSLFVVLCCRSDTQSPGPDAPMTTVQSGRYHREDTADEGFRMQFPCGRERSWKILKSCLQLPLLFPPVAAWNTSTDRTGVRIYHISANIRLARCQ